MDKEKKILPIPVEILLKLPFFGEAMIKVLPQIKELSADGMLTGEVKLDGLRNMLGLTEEQEEALYTAMEEAGNKFDAISREEVLEFGVPIDLDAPCHQWSNTDEEIQLACVEDIEKKYEGRKGEIIFYGPSNIQMWYSLEKDMLPYAAQNHGMGGCVDDEMIIYAKRMLYVFEPAVVFFQTGSNDLALGLSLEQILENKKKMYDLFLENMPDTKLVVMSGLPLPSRQVFWEDTTKVNALLKNMCDKTERMYFMDATDVMTSGEGPENMKTFDGRYFIREYFRMDGIHLNKKGHDVWTAKMKAVLKEIL